MTALLARGQAKLAVGPAGDRFEVEADQVAAQVVARLASPATGPGAEPVGAVVPATGSEGVGRISRRPEVTSEVGTAGGPLGEATEQLLHRSGGGGRPLEASARRTMEGAFDADFSGVRLHTDDSASELNQRVQAKAFTVGSEIFFRDGAPNTQSRSGQELLAHELTHTIQQGGAVHRLTEMAPIGVQRALVKVSGEDVECADDKEEAEAKDIFETLKVTYGVDINSSAGVQAIKDQYTNVPKDVLDSLSGRQWHMVELRALLQTMEHYAAIMGAERQKSTRKASPQEVIAVGKVTQAIDSNTSAGALDTTTLGEYFRANKTMNLFKAQEGGTSDFPGDELKQLTGTFVHEMAHGLLAYAYNDFVKKTGGFWTDQNTKSGKTKVEAPITGYGTTNAREDLCETAMMYFVEPESLKNGRGGQKGEVGNPAPLRYAFMTKITNDWLPPPPRVTDKPKTATTVTKSPEKPKKKPWYKFWK